MSLQVELVSPERVAFSGEAKMVIARTTSGDIAFLDGHIPLVGVLATHTVRVVLADDSEQVIAVHSGFVEVAQDDGVTKVMVLSDTCELAEDIDVDRATAARERAETAIAADALDATAAEALKRANVRLAAAGAA